MTGNIFLLINESLLSLTYQSITGLICQIDFSSALYMYAHGQYAQMRTYSDIRMHTHTHIIIQSKTRSN